MPITPRSSRSRSRSGRPLRLALAAALAAAAVTVAGSPAASAATIDDPGQLIEGTVATFTGTCDDGNQVSFEPSWGFAPSTAAVSADGTWEVRYIVEPGADPQVTASCGNWDGTTFTPTDAPVQRPVEVVAPRLDIEVTVGTEAGTCATTEEITVQAGETVHWCATITNRSGIDLEYHEIAESLGGPILADEPLAVAPGASVSTVDLGLDLSDVAAGPLANEITWTTYGLDGPARYNELTAADTATVVVVSGEIPILPGDTTTTTPGTTPPPAGPATPARPVTASPSYTG